jgi:hypothetical protein
VPLVSGSLVESALVSVGELEQFLGLDLVRSLNQPGLTVFEPQEQWSVAVEHMRRLNAYRSALPEEASDRIASMSRDLQVDLNAIVDLLREMIDSNKSGNASGDDMLARMNAAIERAREHFSASAEPLKLQLKARRDILAGAPASLADSLEKLLTDYPDPQRTVFMVMRFSTTKIHNKIARIVKKALLKHGIHGLRADDKQYHDDLFSNVETYMHGCGAGIAIFDRIEQEDFNPNVSLEIGYMTALRKPVLFLKDRTLPVLHVDLMGKLYRSFDVFSPERTIPEQIERWLIDRNMAVVGRTGKEDVTPPQ